MPLETQRPDYFDILEAEETRNTTPLSYEQPTAADALAGIPTEAMRTAATSLIALADTQSPAHLVRTEHNEQSPYAPPQPSRLEQAHQIQKAFLAEDGTTPEQFTRIQAAVNSGDALNLRR